MKTTLALIPLTLFAFMAGCSKESSAAARAASTDTASDARDGAAAKADKEEDCDSCGGAMAEDTAEATDALARGITLTEKTPISAILAAPEDYEGKRVLVEGPAVAVCKKRGCWVQVKCDGDDSKSLFVKVTDGEIVFPVELTGHDVTVEGIVQKIVTPVETLREAMAKKAEERGESFDPESVTEPRITWRLRGLGATWEL